MTLALRAFRMQINMRRAGYFFYSLSRGRSNDPLQAAQVQVNHQIGKAPDERKGRPRKQPLRFVG
jgi:hypothetical protein